jgi:hypothetical protein
MKIANYIITFRSPIVVNKSDNVWTKIKDTLEESKLLAALKLYKEHTGLGFKEAKTHFDLVRYGICASHNNEDDPQTGYNSPKGAKTFVKRLKKFNVKLKY